MALRALCRGQSVGNPAILTPYETKDFLAKWAAHGKVAHEAEDLYTMQVDFPEHNFGTEGVTYLLSVILGGQCDIDLLQSCRLIRLELGSCERHYPRPRYGVVGIRERLSISSRALVGGIIKPKIGLSPTQLAEVVKQMVDGGLDFIKEDEILADQFWCPMRKRLPLVAKVWREARVLYAACVTGDGSQVWRKARAAKELGAPAVHCIIWAGLGTYADLRRHVDLPIFFQKSGDKVWTTGPFSIDAAVLCQLVHLVGCDFAHVGMYGGYLAEEQGVLTRRMQALRTTLPSLSCGMTPELATQIIERFGTDLMVTSGGWVHGQAEGITAACQRLRRAVDAASHRVVSGRMVGGRVQTLAPPHTDV